MEMIRTKLDALKKLAGNLGVDASDCMTNAEVIERIAGNFGGGNNMLDGFERMRFVDATPAGNATGIFGWAVPDEFLTDTSKTLEYYFIDTKNEVAGHCTILNNKITWLDGTKMPSGVAASTFANKAMVSTYKIWFTSSIWPSGIPFYEVTGSNSGLNLTDVTVKTITGQQVLSLIEMADRYQIYARVVD